VALPAFAAERRAAAPLLLGARPCSNRSMSHAAGPKAANPQQRRVAVE